jgi:hypothetical protein
VKTEGGRQVQKRRRHDDPAADPEQPGKAADRETREKYQYCQSRLDHGDA